MENPKCECAVTYALSVIGGKWKIIIICRLHEGVKRFGELRRSIPGITTKMLTQQLRELENDNIIHRKVYSQVPPKVEYTLTDFGMSIQPILLALNEWGLQYMNLKSTERLES